MPHCHLLNLQVAWLAAFLASIPRTTRNSCRQAIATWALTRTEEIAAQAEAGDSTAVWQLARVQRFAKKRPKMAEAPVHDELGRVVTDHAQLTALCTHQFVEELSGQVTRVSPHGAPTTVS